MLSVRGFLNRKAPVWAQILVSGASLLVAILRWTGAFRLCGVLDICLLLVAAAMLILVAHLGLHANRTVNSTWGWGAVMGYGMFGAILIGIQLRLLSF